MDIVQAVAALILAIAGFISTGTFVLRRSEKRQDRALAGERAANAELLAELRKDNDAQGCEIKALQKRDRENSSALRTAKARVDELQTLLNGVLKQLEAVHSRLNREESENNKKAEVITVQETQIATLERQSLQYRTQRDEARLSLALLSRREGKEQADTEDLTEAAARVTAAVNGAQPKSDKLADRKA